MSAIKPRFPLGQIVITRAALLELSAADPFIALRRHHAGDWGEVDPEDANSNEIALREGLRLFSAYRSAVGIKFWIITEWDRSVTTILLPSDY